MRRRPQGLGAVEKHGRLPGWLGGLASLVGLMAGSLLWPSTLEAAPPAIQYPQVALVGVQYDASPAQPAVAPYMADLSRAMERLWSGTVWTHPQTRDAMHTAWVFDDPGDALTRLGVEAAQAREVFDAQGPPAAIPRLEALMEQADGLLPLIGASPQGAEALLGVHLLLWWALEESGEQGRLDGLMAATARRFPAASVNTRQWPPHIAEAFAQARRRLTDQGVSISFRLQNAPPQGCTIHINGFAHGDHRVGGLAVFPGAPHYVSARCGEAWLRPRRVTLNGNTHITLDADLSQRLRPTTLGPTLVLPGGPDQLGTLVRLTSTLGRALQASSVLAAGVFEHHGQPTIQIDRVEVASGLRACSVRMNLGAMEPWAFDEAIHALHLCRPTENTAIEFAREDNVYRSVGEYVAWATDESDHTWTWISGGATALALGTAIFFEATATGLRDDLAACIAAPSCRTTTEVNRLRSDIETQGIARNLALATTGVLALGTLLVWTIEHPDQEDILAPPPPRPHALTLTPWLDPRHVGVGLTLPLD